MFAPVHKKITFIFIFLFLNVVALIAQDFTATTAVKEAVVNQPFEVIYTLKNVQGQNFTPPSFQNLKVVSGPSKSSSTTIINGQVSSETSISYTLMPTQTGVVTIPPATIRTPQGKLSSNRIQIKVKEAKKIDLSGNGELPDVFVKLEISDEEAYTGQQILLDYRLYTAVDLQDINIISESEYKGFFFESLRRFSRTQSRQKVGKKEYLSQLVRRIALFPQQAGTYEIEPSQVSAQIITGTIRRGFFTQTQTKPIYLTTEPITIKVKSLPTANKPTYFAGAVGNDFNLNVTIPHNNLTTDDAITLRLDIRGNGDIKRVQAPTLDFGNDFEVYEPKVLQEENYENRGELYGKKLIEYLVLPKKPGAAALDAKFYYFNPDSLSYQVASAKTPLITIKQGAKKSKDINLNRSQSIEDNTILPNKTTANFSKKSKPFFGTGLFWVLLVLPILVFLAAIIYKKKQAAIDSIDTEKLKRQRAVKVANEKLSKAKKHMNAGNSRAFYDEVQRALLGYVGDKLQIPPAEMSKSNVKQRLEALKVNNINIDSFLQILQSCEMALFAGMDNSAAMAENYTDAEKTLVKIEEEIS